MAQVEVGGGSVKHNKRMPKMIIKKIKACLNWSGSYQDKYDKAIKVKQKLTGNAKFPVPYPINIVTLTQLGTDIDTWKTTHDKHEAGLVTPEDVYAAEVVVQTDLLNIMTMVQIAMDSDPANAEGTCLGAGYDVKNEAHRPKRKNAVKPGSVPGTVIFTGEGSGTHQWQVSRDGGKTVADINPSTGGVTKLDGQQSDTRLWQRNRCVLTKGQFSPWSDWTSGMVP